MALVGKQAEVAPHDCQCMHDPTEGWSLAGAASNPPFPSSNLADDFMLTAVCMFVGEELVCPTTHMNT